MLRIRNARRELNDIRFEYKPEDSPKGIATELLATGLIADSDLESISKNLKQLVENPPVSKVLTFRASTGFSAAEQPDETNLLGFAQLSLTD